MGETHSESGTDLSPQEINKGADTEEPTPVKLPICNFVFTGLGPGIEILPCNPKLPVKWFL